MKVKISLSLFLLLLISYLMIRVVYFDLHGMIQFTDTLILINCALTAMFILSDNYAGAIITALAYPLGFVFAYLFMTKTESGNNLWIIWLVIEFIFVLSSIGLQLFHVKHKTS